MTRVGIISQARMTSTRLPGKVLMQAGGKSMLEWHIERLRSAGYPIILATTTNPTDDPLVELADRLGVEVFRGSEDDVLSRFAGAAEKFKLDVVVRVTSDCPLIDGSLVGSAIDTYLELNNDDAYISNTVQRSFPRGLDFEVFSAKALSEANANATDQPSREHVTPYIHQNRSGRVEAVSIVAPVDASQYRITLDTHEDLTVITQLIETLGAGALDASQIARLLVAHPKITQANAHIEQKKLGD